LANSAEHFMGFFRYLLAVAVVIGHTQVIDWLPIIGAGLAVKLFFIVSGFYMGLIQTQKYGPLPNGKWLFYSNRFLRLFPVFWLILTLELSFLFAQQRIAPHADLRFEQFTHLFDSGGWVPFANVVSQLSLFGNELFSLVSWTSQDHFSLHTSSVPADAVRGWQFIVMPHTWTLSCELFFYALIPFLNRLSTKLLVVVVAINIAVSSQLGVMIDPTLADVANDYFAPLQLGFFIVGLLAFRIWNRWGTWLNSHSKIAIGAATVLFAATLCFGSLLQLSHRGSLWGIYLLTILTLPALFQLTKNSRIDRQIGNLSYPLYLVHILIIRLIGAIPGLGDNEAFLTSQRYPFTTILIATLAAWAVNRCVEIPIDRFRSRRVPA